MWLECWSDGNPAAQYLWIDWTSGRRTAGRVYRVDRGSDDAVIVEPTDLTLQCHSNNVIAQRSYVAVSSNISINLTTAAAAAPCNQRTYVYNCSRNQNSTWGLVRIRVKNKGLATGRA